MQAVQSEKQALEQKLAQAEKSLAESSEKLGQFKKEKLKLDTSLKQSRAKVNELESFVTELEHTAQAKLQDFSKISQETLTVAQFRLKYAFKSVDNYEKIMLYLYESLLNRTVDLRKKIKARKIETLNKKSEKSDVLVDSNMKMAMSLASSVLNLTSNELDDIMSTSLNETNTTRQRAYKAELEEKMKEDECIHKKTCKKLLFEFEQCLNESKKEKEIFDGSHANNEFDNEEQEMFNKNIYELIVKRLDDVLTYERELAALKVQ